MTERYSTGNTALDMELPLLTMEELSELARLAKGLRLLRENDEDDESWADAPLTPEEEAQLEESRKDFENGKFLTLEQLLEGI